jgi:hypothetical protein
VLLTHDCIFIWMAVACYKFFVGDTIMGIDEMMYDNMKFIKQYFHDIPVWVVLDYLTIRV